MTYPYENITSEVKAFFIKDYSEKAAELRAKAANPKAMKAAQFTASAEMFESIISQLKAA